MVDWAVIVLKESALGSIEIIKSLVVIIFPVMIILQIMTDYKWLEKLSEKAKWITNFLGVSKDAIVPLLIGVFAGVAFGAGAIIFAKEKYNIGKDDIFLIMCFLLTLHGVVDSTLLYWMIGVNPVILLGCRIVIALTGTLLFKWRIQKRKNKEAESLNEIPGRDPE